jgi:hypothetical protein
MDGSGARRHARSQAFRQGRPTFIVALGNFNEGPDDPKVEVGLWVTAEGGPPFWEDISVTTSTIVLPSTRALSSAP